MTATTTHKPPIWFWVVGSFALLWNLFGVYNYLDTAYNKEVMMESLNEIQKAAFENIPAWATACFAFAVFSGSFASIGILLRKKWATPLFILSLITAIAQFTHWLFVNNAVEAFGPVSYVMPILVVAVGFLLIIFSKNATRKGWIK